MSPDTATITETEPGGQQQAYRDHGWGAVLADGTSARVFLTAKVRTTKIPVLDVGQVIHIARSPAEGVRCSVDPADFDVVSPSKLARRIASQASRGPSL